MPNQSAVDSNLTSAYLPDRVNAELDKTRDELLSAIDEIDRELERLQRNRCDHVAQLERINPPAPQPIQMGAGSIGGTSFRNR